MGFEIINKLKKAKGLTNAQLSVLSGVTLSTLDKITAGINKNPKLDTLQAICNALGCSLDDFSDNPRKEKPPALTEIKAGDTITEGAQQVAVAYDKADSGTQASVRKLLDICDEQNAAIERQLAAYRVELEAEAKGENESQALPQAKDA